MYSIKERTEYLLSYLNSELSDDYYFSRLTEILKDESENKTAFIDDLIDLEYQLNQTKVFRSDTDFLLSVVSKIRDIEGVSCYER